MNKKILALILALVMALSLLTGCDGAAKGAETSAAASSAVDERTQAIMDALAEAVPQEAREDVVSYLTDGTLKSDSVVMTVGGKDVTAGYYLFWLGRELSSMNNYYQQFGQTLDLDSEFEEGQTTLDYLKSTAERYVRTFNAIEQKAAEKEVALTEEQEQQLAEYVESLDEVSMTYYATTLEDQKATYTQNLLSPNLKEKLTGLGELDAGEEAMAAYIQENGCANTRYVLYQVASDADEKTDAEQKAAAQAAYDELSKLSGDELLTKFQEYQKLNADGNTNEFSFNATSSIDEDFRAKALELQENQVGLTDKTNFGYFVILRLPVDVESLKPDYLEEAYGKQLEQWAEEIEMTNTAEMDKLDVKAVCTKLLEMQNTMNTAAQEASAALDAAESSAAAAESSAAAAESSAAAAESSAASAEASAASAESSAS